MEHTGDDFKNRSLWRRTGYALNGIFAGLNREGSLRLELAVAAVTLVLLAWLRPPAVWWAVGVLMIAAVLAAELINSAIEALADHLHPTLHREIRVVKDMAAGAILVLNLAALILLALLLMTHFG
ncbi:MAG: diacylglycerol kinase [Alphaproteobacteria bacterium]|nr:diacylglycerol kinase [Alphaproteobacteria bacterium]